EGAAHDTSEDAYGGKPYLRRWTYVILQVRHNLILILPPLLLLIAQQTITRVFPQLATTWVYTLLAAVMLISLMLGVPWGLRIFLGWKPLPDGPLRRRLLATAKRLRFHFSDILLWEKHNAIANAMVTGVLPQLRYVVLTDPIPKEFSQEEIDAVFGHEVGHIRHHHMLFYMFFLMSSMVVLVSLCGAVVWWLGLESLDSPLIAWLREYEVVAMLPMILLIGVYV